MAYLEVLEKVEKAKIRAGRVGEAIQVVAVSKGRPLSALLSVYENGARDFGENRIPEFLEKLPNTPTDIRWHFIGTLQRNKVHKAIGHFTLIHSVDRPELAEKIDQAGGASLLLQVNTSGESTKHGLTIEQWRPHLESLFSLKQIQIKGLMTMAPLTEDHEVIRKTFRSLRQFRDELHLPLLSMGMSHDYEIAIEEGANILRIGSAIFE